MSDIYYVRRGKTEYRWDLCKNDEWCCTVDHGAYYACLTVSYLEKYRIWVSNGVITLADDLPKRKQRTYDRNKYIVMECAINFLRREMNRFDRESDERELYYAVNLLRAQEESEDSE